MQSYGRLLGMVWAQRGAFLAAIACSAILAVAQGGYAWLLGPVLKFVYSAEAAARLRTVIPVSLHSRLETPGGVAMLLAAAIILTSIIRGFAQFGSQYGMAKAGQRVIQTLRANLYLHVLRLPIRHFRHKARGDLVTRLTSDALEIQGTVTVGLSSLAQQLLQVAILAALAMTMDPILGVLAFSALPLLAFQVRRVGRTVRQEQLKAWDAQGELASAIEQTAAAAPVIKAFTSENAQAARFQKLDAAFFRHLLSAVRTQAALAPLSEILGALALAATLWYANARVAAGTLLPEDFVSFFAAVFLAYRPVRGLGDNHAGAMRGVAALDRLDEIFGTPIEPVDHPGCIEATPLSDEIRFEDVHYGYEDEPESVLRGVNLTLHKGEIVALAGASGAGKSTLVSLLLRFEDPTSGRILLDGVPLDRVSRRSLRQQCALVTQDPLLLRDSIRGNITCAEEHPDRGRLEKAVRMAGLEPLLATLPDGLDTDVGEGGTRFSGGERQRICLARAFYRDAPIVILDEATSSLDAAAERELSEALERLIAGRTVLLISHRLSSVRFAHRIAVLESGRIVEEGRHEALWAREGSYRRLFRAQATPELGA